MYGIGHSQSEKKSEKVFVLNTRYGILILSCAEDIGFIINIVNEI